MLYGLYINIDTVPILAITSEINYIPNDYESYPYLGFYDNKSNLSD